MRISLLRITCFMQLVFRRSDNQLGPRQQALRPRTEILLANFPTLAQTIGQLSRLGGDVI